MHAIDYDDWEAYHFAAFPSSGEWLASRPAAAQTRALWQKVLVDCQLADCKQASDIFLAGNEEPPKSPQDWPRFIRRVAVRLAGARRKQGRTFFDGEEAFRCVVCCDVGHLSVWHPQSIEAARTGTLRSAVTKANRHEQRTGSVPRYSCLVACGCMAGDRWLSLCGRRFDQHTMPRWIGWDREANERSLAEFLTRNQVPLGF